MLNKDLVSKFKDRYKTHPLIFCRSVEKARSDTDLFDILDTIPNNFPIVWSEEDFRWVPVEKIHMIQDFTE
jgi:hypothetical protein